VPLIRLAVGSDRPDSGTAPEPDRLATLGRRLLEVPGGGLTVLRRILQEAEPAVAAPAEKPSDASREMIVVDNEVVAEPATDRAPARLLSRSRAMSSGSSPYIRRRHVSRPSGSRLDRR
jgi:hypothetical protein